MKRNGTRVVVAAVGFCLLLGSALDAAEKAGLAKAVAGPVGRNQPTAARPWQTADADRQDGKGWRQDCGCHRAWWERGAGHHHGHGLPHRETALCHDQDSDERRPQGWRRGRVPARRQQPNLHGLLYSVRILTSTWARISPMCCGAGKTCHPLPNMRSGSTSVIS